MPPHSPWRKPAAIAVAPYRAARAVALHQARQGYVWCYLRAQTQWRDSAQASSLEVGAHSCSVAPWPRPVSDMRSVSRASPTDWTSAREEKSGKRYQSIRWLAAGAPHHSAEDSFISTRPLTISTAAQIRRGVSCSPSKVMPTTNAPTAPIPVQIV